MKRLVFLLFIFFIRPAYAGEWAAHQASLLALQQSIHEMEKAEKEAALTLQKAHLIDERRAAEKHIQELRLSLHDEKRKYFSEVKHVKYQHPERGQDLAIHMKNAKVTTIEPESQKTSFEQMLADVKDKMVALYGDYQDPKRNIASKKFQFLIEREEAERIEALRPILRVK